jgi:hypothetical protein
MERAGEISVTSTKVVVARIVVGEQHSLSQTPIEDDVALAIVFSGSLGADGARPAQRRDGAPSRNSAPK